METNVTHSDFAIVRPETGQPAGATLLPGLSGVSWGAVFGGAFVIAAVHLTLLTFGAAFGWNIGALAATVGAAWAIIWLILIEAIACAMGGYLTGRLRSMWTMIHNEGVLVRDTANGFLAWAVALVAGMAFLRPAAESMAGRGGPIMPQAAGTTFLPFWIFVSLVVGAICASFAATLGGRQRDRVKPA